MGRRGHDWPSARLNAPRAHAKKKRNPDRVPFLPGPPWGVSAGPRSSEAHVEGPAVEAPEPVHL